jgi:hypothetical protein
MANGSGRLAKEGAQRRGDELSRKTQAIVLTVKMRHKEDSSEAAASNKKKTRRRPWSRFPWILRGAARRTGLSRHRENAKFLAVDLTVTVMSSIHTHSYSYSFVFIHNHS